MSLRIRRASVAGDLRRPRRADRGSVSPGLPAWLVLGQRGQGTARRTGRSDSGHCRTGRQHSQLSGKQFQTASTSAIAPEHRITRTPPPLTAAPAGGADGAVQIPGVPGGSVPWSVVVLLTTLTLIPSILLCMTPFARLLIVFHFLRQALGLQTTPSNQTLIGLSLILTFFLMQPVANEIYQNSVRPHGVGADYRDRCGDARG